ncbi:hypothetical protein DPMN_169516 [Dreissena polymorpha]|uniref:Uncharacterized protein n=1 Tax=Dreissena polymorpha TaxID=45954 RepID=A0A9D4ICB5_DREPO|nr:hypothetical protein DPMN_169516 [Dreissena polymorpha]
MHRNIDHDWQMTPIDFQVTSSTVKASLLATDFGFLSEDASMTFVTGVKGQDSVCDQKFMLITCLEKKRPLLLQRTTPWCPRTPV